LSLVWIESLSLVLVVKALSLVSPHLCKIY
jgi:hypothetical protein